MSAPGDGPQYGGPQYNPYGQPGSYRAGQEPGQYTSSPPAGQPYPAPGQQPYGYNPYGGQQGPGYPAGFAEGTDAPAARPGLMVLGLVLMILAALPFLVGGIVGLAGLDTQSISDQLLNNPQFAAAGATPELVASLIQVMSVALLVGAIVYLLLAISAFRGRNWARITVTVLSAGFVLLLVAGLAGAGGAGGVLGFVLFLLVAVVAGVVILFMPDSNRYFSAPHRRSPTGRRGGPRL